MGALLYVSQNIQVFTDGNFIQYAILASLFFCFLILEKRPNVLPAMLRKFITAKRNGDASVTIWGTGSPKREFLYADDLAEACLFLMENYNDSGLVNIGIGDDISILDLAHLVKKTVGFKGTILTYSSKPDGTPRKLMDVSKLSGLGWKAKISLEEGIQKVYEEIKNKDWNR